MFGITDSTRVFLYLGVTDMRRGSLSLTSIVQECHKRTSLDGSLYVFISRDKKKVKILHWKESGYWLHYKRLETSTFRVKFKEDGSEELSAVDLGKLLSGIDLKSIKLSRKIAQKAIS